MPTFHDKDGNRISGEDAVELYALAVCGLMFALLVALLVAAIATGLWHAGLIGSLIILAVVWVLFRLLTAIVRYLAKKDWF